MTYTRKLSSMGDKMKFQIHECKGSLPSQCLRPSRRRRSSRTRVRLSSVCQPRVYARRRHASDHIGKWWGAGDDRSKNGRYHQLLYQRTEDTINFSPTTNAFSINNKFCVTVIRLVTYAIPKTTGVPYSLLFSRPFLFSLTLTLTCL